MLYEGYVRGDIQKKEYAKQQGKKMQGHQEQYLEMSAMHQRPMGKKNFMHREVMDLLQKEQTLCMINIQGKKPQ